MTGIYKITNPKGRIYIGQSVDIEKRWKRYYALHCIQQIKLHYSLKKYGIEKHVFEIIEECLERDLNKRERYWQDYYDVLSVKGLNCKLVETQDKSGRVSEEVKEKISTARKGYKHSEEAKKKMSKQRKGRVLSEQTKEKISRAMTGLRRSEEAKARMSKAQKGKIQSKETVQKRAEANVGRSPWNKGKTIPIETKQKIASTLKGRVVSEETRKKLSAARKGKKTSEETKKKISETLKNKPLLN